MVGCNATDKYETTEFDGVFEIDLPSYFTKADLDNEDAIMQYGNLLKEFYAMMIYEPQVDLIEIKENYSLADYADFNLQNIKASLMHPKVQRVSSFTKVNGADCIAYKIWGLFPEINEEMFYYLTIFKTDLNFYSFHTWTMASQESKHINTMEKMITSFKEL
ncbi:hypothetical protein DNU06_02095 [Putridiphycobacter roseus]|uniref:Uncharacterized protein n=2 Tax=Putridiphycobacter roseus TaxID=2219161 RepID=A0A2W1N472_9FLAO|nr:hypothetical protein DNU06_02095 [Putridiphycobacter roseus]